MCVFSNKPLYSLFQISGKKSCEERSKVVKLFICTPKGKGSILEVEIRNIIIQDFIIQTTKNLKLVCFSGCSLYDEILNYDISDFDLMD